MELMDRFFKPRSVAVIGASGTPGKLGYVIVKNIVDSDFAGRSRRAGARETRAHRPVRYQGRVGGLAVKPDERGARGTHADVLTV